MSKALAITEKAIELVASEFYSGDDWFSNFQVSSPLLQRDVSPSGVVYIFTNGCAPDSRLAIFNLAPDGFFQGIHEDYRVNALERSLRLARNAFDPTVRIPSDYCTFHAGNKISIFSTNYHTRSGDRIVAVIKPQGASCILFHAISDAPEVFSLEDYEVDEGIAQIACEGLAGAIERSGGVIKAQTRGGINLETVFEDDNITRGLTYHEWFPDQLSPEQRSFVKEPLEGPIRLRGAAGTGKTIAMVIKALKTIYDAEDNERTCKILYATHSWAAVDHVEGLIKRIDVRNTLKRTSEGFVFDVFPLLTLADEAVVFNKQRRKLLGHDSLDGKRHQLVKIRQAIVGFKSGDWFTYRDGCSGEFCARVEAADNTTENLLFAWDLMNEFSAVFAAAGLLPRHREDYLRLRRAKWMMTLANDAEKETVLLMYKGYLDILKGRGETSSDQLISDYLNHLSTFAWEGAREEEGYDAVFVDEMHLFDAQERFAFHLLLNNPDCPPKVVMAIDPTQSPLELFVNIIKENERADISIYTRAKLNDPKLIELTVAYRYTPQINSVIRGILDTVPAMDLGKEWEVPRARSDLSDGPVPVAHLCKNKLDQFRRAFDEAKALAQTSSGRVAVLCLNVERYEEYMRAAKSQYEKNLFVINSRADSENLRFAKKRFVLSMPEFVGGLQFETVFILDVNDNLVPMGRGREYALRRFLSELYLGASRAEKNLLFYATADDNGFAEVIKKLIGDEKVAKGT